MADKSGIEWTEATWNPTTGCDRVSPGCDNCYALTLAKRLKGMGSAKYQTDGDPRTSGPGFGLSVHEDTLSIPLHWKQPRRVFVNSMSDLFHDRVPDEFIARVFAVMALTPRHTYQVLTKRHGRMRALLNRPDFREAVAEHATDLIGSRSWQRWQLDLGGQRLAGDSGLFGGWTTTPTSAGNLWSPPWPLPNVWLGVSVENQQWADIRIPALLETPAAVRWLSCEPLLGPVNLGAAALRPYEWWQGGFWEYGHGEDIYGNGKVWVPAPPAQLDWVVVGGESGPGARPMHPDWPRSLVEQCQAAGVAPFVKQLGSVWAQANGADSKGGNWDFWPAHLRVREYPA